MWKKFYKKLEPLCSLEWCHILKTTTVCLDKKMFPILKSDNWFKSIDNQCKSVDIQQFWLIFYFLSPTWPNMHGVFTILLYIMLQMDGYTDNLQCRLVLNISGGKKDFNVDLLLNQLGYNRLQCWL